MKDPRYINIYDYSYSLPDDRIAKFPLPERDDSKLLVYREGRITENTYAHLPSLLSFKSLVVFNDTRVVEARLLFKKPTGGMIEIFCLEPGPDYPDITTAMQQKEKVYWKCLVGGASKWKPGQVLEKLVEPGGIMLRARYVSKIPDAFIIELSWSAPDLSFAELLHHAGAIPLPPYIKRDPESSDAERYQTIYANEAGSVAAPTAGLHFTDMVMKGLEDKGIEKEFVTLHVGAGTFKPVKAQVLTGHEMHAEWIDVKRETIEKIVSHLDGNIIAVGTTSLRTLESLYWIGRKLMNGNTAERIQPVGQWEPYDSNDMDISALQSLSAILGWMKKNDKKRLITQTKILIAPGYDFKIVNTLVTNFHQPQSTLLLLIAAFIGEDWRKVYEYALNNDYRFLSYGDGCLLFR